MKWKTRHVEYELKEGIMYGRYKPGVKIDLKVAKEMVQDRLEVQKGKSYCTFIYFTIHDVDKDAREYMNNEGAEGLIKGALYVESFLTAAFVNFFMKVYKPTLETRIFTNKEKAIKWLKE